MKQKTLFIAFLSFLSLLFLVSGQEVQAYEKADAFVVKIYDKSMRVLSPVKYDKALTVIIDNRTLSKVTGKIETESGVVMDYVAIGSGETSAYKVGRLNKEKVYFVPMSPPLQKVELKLGNKPYEIPPHP